MMKKDVTKVKKQTIVMPEMKNFPSIRKGSTGGYVTVAQTNLKNRGYDIGQEGVDGIFGEKTANAVKEFQKDIGMPVPNGSVGPKTWAAMQNSMMTRIRPEPVPIPVVAAVPHYQLVISNLTKYQADMLAKLLGGGLKCEVVG